MIKENLEQTNKEGKLAVHFKIPRGAEAEQWTQHWDIFSAHSCASTFFTFVPCVVHKFPENYTYILIIRVRFREIPHLDITKKEKQGRNFCCSRGIHEMLDQKMYW